jgi:predicted nucleotidyltransferase
MKVKTKKATFNLPVDVLTALDEAMARGIASSKNALVERALVKELQELRRQERKALWQEAARDPLFLKGIAAKEVERDIVESVAGVRGKMVDILRKHDVSRAAFFGSAATGKLRDDSDIDILVEFKGDKSLIDLVALKQELEDISGKQVDVVTYNSLHPFIREEVLREQVAIL